MLSADNRVLCGRDTEITALADVLDAERLTEHVGNALALPPEELEGVRVEYVRYKPTTSLLASVVVTTPAGPQRLWAVAGAATLADKLAKVPARWARDEHTGPSPGFSPVLTQRHLLIAPLQADRMIPGIRRLLDRPADVVRGADRCEVIAYKPGRRLVTRLDIGTSAVGFAKAHRKAWESPVPVVSGVLRQAGIATPEVIGVRRRGSIIVTAPCGGEPVDGQSNDPVVLKEVGCLLARFHRVEAPHGWVPVDLAPRAFAAARAVADVVPHLAATAHSTAVRAVQSVSSPPPTCLVHGDTSADQFLTGPQGVSVLDLDRTRIDHPLVDAASWFADEYAAKRLPASADPGAVTEPLVAEEPTGHRDLQALASVALLERSVEPFRLGAAEPAGWSLRVEELVHAAAALAGTAP